MTIVTLKAALADEFVIEFADEPSGNSITTILLLGRGPAAGAASIDGLAAPAPLRRRPASFYTRHRSAATSS